MQKTTATAYQSAARLEARCRSRAKARARAKAKIVGVLANHGVQVVAGAAVPVAGAEVGGREVVKVEHRACAGHARARRWRASGDWWRRSATVEQSTEHDSARFTHARSCQVSTVAWDRTSYITLCG